MPIRRAHHVIHLSQPGASSADADNTDARAIDDLFARIDNQALPILLDIHGGLVPASWALEHRVDVLARQYLDAGFYPVFLVWETGPQAISRQVLDSLFTRPAVQPLLRWLAWNEPASGPAGFASTEPPTPEVDDDLLRALAADPEATDALRPFAAPDEGPSGILPVVGMGLSAAVVAAGAAIWHRVDQRRDGLAWNGQNDTLLEETMRLLYVGPLARLGWEQMKTNAKEAWRPQGSAAPVLAHLEAQRKKGRPLAVLAHSAGAYHAGALLDALSRKQEGGDVFNALMLAAPACDEAFFEQTIAARAARVGRLGLFVLHREIEDSCAMIAGVYRGSLLNLISGLLEPEPGWPVLGLERFRHQIDGLERVVEEPNLYARSPQSDGQYPTDSAAHRAFDRQPQTHASLMRFAREVIDR